MKLLFDENLSPRLVETLRDAFPESEHVGLAGLRGQSDRAIWDYARQHGLVIVSKDNDFRQMAFVEGPPSKVIWLSVANASTRAIVDLLAHGVEAIRAFIENPEESLLVLKTPPGEEA